MTTSRYKLYETVFNEKESRDMPGFIRPDIKNFLSTTMYITIEIPISMDCRPDLIAYQYFFAMTKVQYPQISHSSQMYADMHY